MSISFSTSPKHVVNTGPLGSPEAQLQTCLLLFPGPVTLGRCPLLTDVGTTVCPRQHCVDRERLCIHGPAPRAA